jgi:hypothetical protein
MPDQERKIIGFDEDCEHVLCPRCSKDKLCCEMFRVDCWVCDGVGAVEDREDDSWASMEPEYRTCEECAGRGWHWHCTCDENGQHNTPHD